MPVKIFYNLLTAPRTVSNMYTQVAQAQLCANHVQHVKHLSRASVMLRATWYEGTAQLLSLTELQSHLFELYFIGWTIKPMKVSLSEDVDSFWFPCQRIILWGENDMAVGWYFSALPSLL